MLQKENKDTKQKIKLKDLIEILQAVEKMYKVSSNEYAQISSFIKELINALRPYQFIEGYEFLDMIRDSSLWESSISQKKKMRNRKTSLTINAFMSVEEIKELLSKGPLTKDQLLLISERFGLSKGTLQKLRKEEIKDSIENAIQNIETLKTIQRKAVE